MKLVVRWLTPLVLITMLLAGCAGSSHPKAGVARLLNVYPATSGLSSHRTRRASRATRASLSTTHHLRQHFVIERLDVPKDPALLPSRRLLEVSQQIISTRIAGQHVVIVIPRRSRHRAILFEHGSGETADLDIDAAPSAPTIAALVGAGYTWAESDAGFNNWGDRASLADDVAVARWLHAHGDPVVDIGADSMGGLDATQLIPLIHPQAVFELFPVCDERTVLDEFGILMHRADAPLKRLSPVTMHDVRGLPMLFTASPEDTIVPKVTNADVCTREARAAGARVQEVTTKGEHGNSSNWKASRLVSFLNQAEREYTPSSFEAAAAQRTASPAWARRHGRRRRGARHGHTRRPHAALLPA
jgi:hypothetical protein